MKLYPSPDAFGHVIFCDDIRMEVGNKLTFAGCYLGFMFTNSEFPTTFQRFCFAIEYSQRRDKVVWPVKFVIFLPGDPDDKPSLEFHNPIEVDEQSIADAKAAAIELGGSPDFATITAQLAITNLVISQPGPIKVRAVRGDELVRLGTLRVTRAPS